MKKSEIDSIASLIADYLPYRKLWISHEGNLAFFLKDSDDGSKLCRLDLNQTFELDAGELISDLDFSKQAFLPISYSKEESLLYIRSDQHNRENYSIYSLRIPGNSLELVIKCTKCVFVTSDIDMQKIFYIDRISVIDGKRHNKLFEYNLKTKIKKELYDDLNCIHTLAPGLSISLDTNKIIALCRRDSLRNKHNLLAINIKGNSSKVLLDESQETSRLKIVERNFDTDGIHFISDNCGWDDLFYLYFFDKKIENMTVCDGPTNGLGILKTKSSKNIVNLSYDRDNQQTIINIKSSNFDKSIIKKGNLYLEDNIDGYWLFSSSMSCGPRRQKMKIESENLKETKHLKLFRGKIENLSQCDAEFVAYKTFDGKEIPGYIFKPQKKVLGAIIISFYGGLDTFSSYYAAFCRAGFIVFSPGVRGCDGYGKEWRRLIDGDLGGYEILDLVWAAKWLEREFDLLPAQIGLEGGSHGGYSVLRGLTMPEKFNGYKSSYPFAFGISGMGFADLTDFYLNSSIQDWCIRMLGPYEKNKELYQERSPINHVERLSAPVFLHIGPNDPRCPRSSIDGFVSQLIKLDKPYRVFEIKDQGHTVGAKSSWYELIKQTISFAVDCVKQ